MSARDVVETVRATIAARGLLRGGETVLVAVSGGPDSMTLLHVLHELRDELGLTLLVAHVDHGLREGSAADAELVARAADALGVPFHLHTASGEREPGASPEEAARAVRLGFLAHTARETGATRIATGHTMNDQAETVLMRLVQGTGRRGLGGITPRRWWYVRPLIDLARADTEGFCAARGLPVAIDPTNADRSLVRNEVRHGALPLLQTSLNGRIVEALARLADVIRDEDAYLDEHAAAGAPVVPEGDEVRMQIEALRSLPRALQRRALRLATWTHSNATFAFEHVERLRSLALDGATGDALDLPEGIRARVEYGSLVLGPRSPDAPPPREPADLVVPGETAVAGWDLRVLSWITAEPVATWPDGRGTCVLDADRVRFPLRVRGVAPGDRLTPLGMTGAKKIGDLFTDERVPRAERPRVPLVVDAADEVVWVVGHRIDARAAVTDRTVRFLWMTA